MAFEFTDANVHQIIESGKPCMIDLWATWCGPCKNLGPIVDELADKYAEQVVIGKYNIDDNNDLPNEYRVMSVPTILFFKDGKALKDLRLVGFQQKATLEDRIEKMLAL